MVVTVTLILPELLSGPLEGGGHCDVGGQKHNIPDTLCPGDIISTLFSRNFRAKKEIPVKQMLVAGYQPPPTPPSH